MMVYYLVCPALELGGLVIQFPASIEARPFVLRRFQKLSPNPSNQQG